MKVVITGATGFIGRNLTERALREGHDVHIVSRAESTSFHALEKLSSQGATILSYDNYAELRDQLDLVRPEMVFHLATHYTKSHQSHEIESMIDANVQFGTHLLESLKGSAAVIVSTISYFQFRHGQPVAHSLYSSTKQAFSEVCRYYREVEGLNIREVVLFDTYGSNDPRPKLVPLLVDSAKTGKPVSLGSAEQLINLVHVSDVVEGLVAATVPSAPILMTIKAPRETSVRELVEHVHRVSGSAFPTEYRTDAAPNLHVLESGSWQVPPGWEPRMSLEDGLRVTVDSHATERA